MHDVTIIIPVYCNTEESLVWLDECLSSAVSQGCDVVAWDDGSELNVEALLKHYKVRYYAGDHKGVSHARNQAIIKAKTSLIYPLDCDDTLKPDTIKKLLSVWDNVPVYPDVAKFGDTIVPHYVLLDFDCAHIIKYVGFASVNVLHSKQQWKEIGGYDENIDFFEDGEYNARLFSRYCGVRYPEPLVNYRIHKTQRTQTYKHVAAARAKELLKKIGGYEMACASCDKKRRTPDLTAVNSNKVMTNVDPSAMPATQGNLVLAQYIGGKGRGKHYYDGLSTHTRYKVTYGSFTYADPADTRSVEQIGDRRLLVRVAQAPIAAPVAHRNMPIPEPALAASRKYVNPEEAMQATATMPVVDDVAAITKPGKKVAKELPDISAMTVKAIFSSRDITKDNAAELLAVEEEGLQRTRVVDFLKDKLNAG